MAKTKIKEVDLAEAVIAWLEDQHWDVYQEVKVPRMGGVADIVAVQGFLVWVIECKTSLTWSVIEQARLWRSHFRSVAVPRPLKRSASGRGTAYHVCHQFYKVGVIEVARGWNSAWEVDEQRPAPIMREFHESSKRIMAALRPQHKTYAKAGSLGGNHWSPYKSTMDHVKRFITKNPGCTLSDIMAEDGRWHYASNKSARSSIRSALETFEADWCEVDKSVRPWRYYIRKDKAT